MAKKAPKIFLKIREVVDGCNHVDHYYFDGVVQEFYDVVYEVVEVEKLANKSLLMAPKITGELSKEDKKALQEFKSSKGKSTVSVNVILNDFVANKIIEPGDYCLSAMW